MEKQKRQRPNSFMKNVVKIGLFGGIFWGLVWYLLHIFSFTEVGPNYLLMPLALGSWKEGMWGQLGGVAVMGLFSIGTAILYGLFLKKFQGVVPGIPYGLVWWGLVFFVIGSLSPVLKNALQLPKETVIATICIFILYGVFLSYSVSYEALEENQGGLR
ncbi:YqhR family membrane protein [Ectobacillus ponti]|uniref:YqhR family membrane protein n=1 Tax=Ectobacillus ponti TaxID=2961894 RepID=A0AA41X7Z7_9BACI|nr:YqhR family membrane protein [Ectobacillus ponti]MCP8967066.1 YqhR family membrane protein [Ectobacillus ponti]